ncbi:MAG: protein dehydratase [Bradyrhizobium sp.]|uniref:FAS1-like dehydratase domain-containing protein n=1 Tax=Bradyrhizobium sp. TaxID=376 RepID=UPI001211070D|nr:MaoC family dehydratase N-terminal domain-containing protein [Bradyrhizobium sp.]THD59466.1 MAG: protein dehydratase [Bradyrhizobium sp.]
MTEKPDLDHLRQWIGRSNEASDIVTAQLVRGLRATLFMEIGAPKPGDAAPFTAHWCLAQPVYPMSELGPDGHPTRGGFLPPVPLPRRMWAGGELEFLEPLRVGDEMTRTSRISDVSMKTGSTGALCFVSVEHRITTPRGTALRERQDIVYRDISAGAQTPAPAKPAAAAPAAQHRETHLADPVLLFRYSALTFNGHRIHYDRDYVTKVEGYPGLIFHGPMQAALQVEFAARLHGGAAPKKFSYRGLQPLFEGEFSVNANQTDGGMETWTANSAGQPTMKGTATW